MNVNITFYRWGIELSSKHETHFYYYNEVMYVTYDTPYCFFYCLNNRILDKYMLKISLKKIEPGLPAVFFQNSQHSIINTYYIRSICNDKIVMVDGKSFELPRRHISELKQHKIILEKIPCNCIFCNIYGKNCSAEICENRPNNIQKPPFLTK
jgi:DNA-binding LytR/AlgR family response regulator